MVRAEVSEFNGSTSISWTTMDGTLLRPIASCSARVIDLLYSDGINMHACRSMSNPGVETTSCC